MLYLITKSVFGFETIFDARDAEPSGVGRSPDTLISDPDIGELPATLSLTWTEDEPLTPARVAPFLGQPADDQIGMFTSILADENISGVSEFTDFGYALYEVAPGGDLLDDVPEPVFYVFRDPGPDLALVQRIAISDSALEDDLPQGVVSLTLPPTEMIAALLTGVIDGVAFGSRAEAMALVASDTGFGGFGLYYLSANGQFTPITDVPEPDTDPEPAEPSGPGFDLSDVSVGAAGMTGIASAAQLDGRTVAVMGEFDAQSTQALADLLGIEFGAIRPVDDFTPGFDTPSETSIPIQDLPQALLDDDITAVFILDASQARLARVFTRFETRNESEPFLLSSADEVFAGLHGDDAAFSVTLASVSGAPLDGVALSFSVPGRPEQAVEADGDGGLVFSVEAGAQGRLQAERAYDSGSDPAITPNDALEVLRMGVGLDPSFGPASPQNWVAADIDGNGRVDASDALEILRAAVGLESANAPRWVFLDAQTDWESVVQDGMVSYQEGIEIAAMNAGTDLEMTAILIGSVVELA